MKKLFVSLALLVFCSVTLIAQQATKFMFNYKPDRNYLQTMRQTTQAKIKFSGSEEMMESLKSGGQDSVMETKTEMTMESVIKTGKVKKTGEYPVTMEFTKFDLPAAGGQDMTGMKIFGHATEGKLPTYDSVSSPTMDDEAAEKFVTMMNTMMSQIKYPDTVMKPGDTYRQATPLTVPIAGMGALEMQIESIYKLQSIKDGIGYFDMEQVYSGKTEVQDMKMPMSGTSKGKLEMDIANGFARWYLLDTEVLMDMDVQGMNMKIKSLIHMEMTVKLEKK